MMLGSGRWWLRGHYHGNCSKKQIIRQGNGRSGGIRMDLGARI